MKGNRVLKKVLCYDPVEKENEGWIGYITGSWYGLVSYKAPHAQRPFSDIFYVPFLVIITPDLFTRDLWLKQRHPVAKQGVGEKCS
jgi:hypothetical protein